MSIVISKPGSGVPMSGYENNVEAVDAVDNDIAEDIRSRRRRPPL